MQVIPLNNSINEKCARIRGAFVGEFDNNMALNITILMGSVVKPRKSLYLVT